MNPLATYKIHFIKLKNGAHDYEFELGNSFFEAFDNSIIKEANLKAQVVLYKDQPHMFDLSFDISGDIGVMCDRCLDHFSLPIKKHFDLLVKQTEKEREDEHDISYISMNAYEINISNFLYEISHLALPIQKTCELAKKECDSKTAKKLDELKAENRTQEADPRWDKLKELIKKDKSN